MADASTSLPEGSRLMAYNAERLDEPSPATVEAAIAILRQPTTGWLHLPSLDEQVAAALEAGLGLHHLALEDARNERQRAKTEEYSDHRYIVIRPLVLDTAYRLRVPQLNLFTGEGWIVTIGEEPPGLYDGVRKRIRDGRVRIRSHGSDYLAYTLIDAAVDTYAPVMDETADRLEALEDALLLDLDPEASIDPTEHRAPRTKAPTDATETLALLHAIRRDLRKARRTVAPARDAIGVLLRYAERVDEAGTRAAGQSGKTRGPPPHAFLRDVQDHVLQGIERIDGQRELASSLVELHLSLASHRTNEVMRVLTIVATIFIPLGFLAGVYGMNFDTSVSPYNLPELGWRYGYISFWGLIVLVVSTMFIVFRRRGWL